MKHTMLRLFFALLGLAFTGHAAAATYYVNSNGGNDFYSGTSATATSATVGPWQTLGKLANVTLAPGDTVYLACGSVWKETLQPRSSGTAAAPITITGGPGVCTTAPLIDGATTIPAHAWVQHSGSIYRARLPVDLVANPNPGASMSGWSSWSAAGDSTLVPDNACPGQATPCMAFTSGTSVSLAISNTFPLAGGADYTAGVQLRAPVGTVMKVVVRRAGPTYESLAPEQWITGAGVWQSVGFTFRPGAAVPNARIDIEIPATRIRVNVREAHMRQTAVGADVLATFVDSLQVRRAHHPNFGQAGNPNSPYAAIFSTGGKTTLDASGIALPVGAALAPGLGISIRTTNFSIEERTVSSVSGARLTLSSPTEYDTLPGYGYFVTGALWMLDSPGEWYYDPAAAMLYVWMPDGAAPDSRVATSGLALGAELGGKANITLKQIGIRHTGTGVGLVRSVGVTVSGVTVSDTAEYGVNGENCGTCEVKQSSIARTGLDAINVLGPLAVDFKLSDSSVADSAASARTDGWRFLPRTSRGAVYVIGARPSITRNSIRGTANLGVYLGPNGILTNNFVGQTCLSMNDCGAIYANYSGNNATISANVVQNVFSNLAGLPGTPQAHAVGIYIDDRNTNSVVSGNTVTGADYGIQMHNAHGVTVSNNVVFGNRLIQLWLQERTNLARAAGDVYGNQIVSNLLVPTGSGPAVYLESELGDTADFATFSGNHYSALLSPRVVGERAPTTDRSYTAAEWQAAGRETSPKATAPVGYVSFLVGATNLVPNGNLASGTLGWSWWNQTAPLANALVRACTFGPCADLRAGASASLFSSPNFSVTAGQWYRVSFDAATGQVGQPINVVVRRGGGGSVGYEYLMPSAEAFAGTTTWRRYSFAFQANKTVIAGNPATQEFGARIDFERNQPGSVVSVARMEMVTLTPAQAALQIKLLLNPSSVTASIDCASTGVAAPLCNYFVHMDDGTAVLWPESVSALSGRPVYTRDTTLTDGDGDGIADQQDYCPGSPAGSAVNARGCTLDQ